ncbi:MAG: hypothetical protein ACJAS4_003257 [Bacteriovoracaceae bacterium]|jgi:uncharacterized protein (TIGR02147 family)
MIQIRLYNYECYKHFVNDWIRNQTNAGRGKYLEISKFLSIHTTLTSQIFKGERELNHDQAFLLCDYFGFSQLETEYFLLLVSFNKAANYKLVDYYKNKIQVLKDELSQMKNRIKKRVILGEEQKALFYSNWHYSAVRLVTSLDQINTKEDISNYLKIPLKTVGPIVDFLLSVSLLNEENDKLTIGPTVTHLGPDSPLISNHHGNWRIKAMERHSELRSNEFCFSAPLTINESDVEKVKEILKGSIEQISEIVQASENVDSLYCVNLDWFSPLN